MEVAMTGVKQTRAALERFGERATSLAAWSALYAQVAVPEPPVWGLRFVFYWRYSDADRQDPATSRGWQIGRARAVTAGAGVIMREVSDRGVPREVPWARRPGASELLKAVADPDRDFDAIVVGSHERAFCGNQFSLVAPVLAHYGVQLWLPELGGVVDPSIATVEDLLDQLGILARREVTLKRSRALGAMEYAVRELHRFMGGRPNYGYVFVDVAPHPNRRLGCRGITLQQLSPHPETSQVVIWMFQARLQGHSYRRIARALNDTAIPCPSAADPDRNRHRTGQARTDGVVREILTNPVYAGYGVWGRERTERVLVDPDNPALGYRKVRRHTTPDQWTFSDGPTHPALVSEQDFLTIQTTRAQPSPVRHSYQLTGILACAVCGRRMEGAWSHGNPAYRCRHGHTSTTTPDPTTPGNTFIRERDLLARLPLLHTQLPPAGRTKKPAAQAANKTSTNTAIATQSTAPHPEEVIDYLRQRALVLTYDSRTRTLEANSTPPARVTV
jgi:site-specific DNA recombinase